MSVSANLASRPQSGNGFEHRLAHGQMAETLIAKWLISRGHIVMPVYDIEIDTGKGPRVFHKDFQAAAPDLCVWTHSGVVWCEAKHKTVFSWYRKKAQWETGIDLNHWRDYQKVAEQTGCLVWLLFLHRCCIPSEIDAKFPECPKECPVGLFGQSLDKLQKSVSHDSSRHGRHGMVYWGRSALQMLDTLDNVLAFDVPF